MNFPVNPSPHAGNLALPNNGIEYVAMSVSPLEYKPYVSAEGNTTIGYAGVGVRDGSLVTVARLGEYDDAQSFEMMYNWLRPAAGTCLPETADVSSDLLSKIVSLVDGDEPLALLQLEKNARGEKIISLAAQTKLGAAALAARPEIKPKPRGIQRFMGDKKLKEKAGFGVENYEAIVIGGALILDLFDGRPKELAAGSQQAIAQKTD